MAEKLTIKTVLDRVAEELGLDPEKPGNDPELASEWNVRREKLLKEFGSDDTEIEAAAEEIGKLADLIREDAEQVRLRREEGKKNAGDDKAVDDPNASVQKTQAQIEDGARAMPDVVKRMAERYERYGQVGYSLLSVAAEDSLDDVIGRPSTDEKTKAVQKANDDLLFIGAMLGAHPEDPDRTNWKRWKSFGAFGSLVEAAGYKRAMETGTSASGGYWAPTQMSADLVEKVYEQCNLLPLIPRVDFPMGMATMRIPTEGSDAEIYLTGEADADDGVEKFTASTPGTGYVDVSAKQLTSRIVVSWEMIEDSIVDIMPHVRMKMIRAFTRGLEDAIINGDTSSTHVHGDVTASTDRRKAFDGFIDKVTTDTGANESCATYFNFEAVLAPTLDMNQYAVAGETILLCNSPIKTKLGYLRDTQDNAIQLKYDDVGALGFAATGRVLDFAGYPVVTSAKVRNTVGTSGYWSSSDSTYTTIFWVHLPSWRLAVKRNMTLEGVRRAEQGQQVLVGHWRGGFKHVCATSADYTTAMCYGISST